MRGIRPSYGAHAEHCPVVGTAVIAWMAEVAGERWRPECERAWSAALEVVAGGMLEGAAAGHVDPAV
jgi:hemoglobin-like flavoprotein